MTDEFDPSTVPPFPVITLQLHDDDTVTVDGRPVEIGMDQAPTEAGIEAVTDRVIADGLRAVRVRATSPDGTRFMVVTDQGKAYPLAIAANTEKKAPSRAARAVVIGAAALVVLGGVAGATAFAIATSQSQPAPSPSWTPPNAGANLPVPAPPGYGQAASWAVEVNKSIAPVMVDGSRIALVDTTGALTVLDTDTGKPVWNGSGRVDAQGGIHVSTVEGTPVLTTSSSSTISLWALDKTATTVEPVIIKTGTRATVTYLGSAPLIDLGSQTIALIVNGALTRVDVPVTATPVMATTSGAIAANSAHWWNLSADTQPIEHDMPNPQGVGAQPTLISAADDDHLIVLWPGTNSSSGTAALVRLSDNTIVAEASVPTHSIDARDIPIRSTTGQSVVLGSLYVDYGPNPRLVSVPNLRPAAVHGSTIYGTVSSAPVSATLSGDAFTITPFTAVKGVATAVPAAVTDTQAFVIAKKVEDTLLYALPRQGEEPTK